MANTLWCTFFDRIPSSSIELGISTVKVPDGTRRAFCLSTDLSEKLLVEPIMRMLIVA